MSNKLYLKNKDIKMLAARLNQQILIKYPHHQNGINIYPIPRGGVAAAYALAIENPEVYFITDNPVEADICVDDIIDSGATADKFKRNFGLDTVALIDKKSDLIYMVPYVDKWIVFPWEKVDADNEETIDSNVQRILQFIGEDPEREGLIETPKRVSKAWKQWTSGYGQNPKDILKVFEDGGEKYNQMVIVKDIPIYSKCEHHLADIFGTATIAYIPNGKIVGLSKLSRLADMFARRLQVQERLTQQIADSLQEHLNPIGVGVLIRARHMCMESRGICQQGHQTITTAFHGALLSDVAARQEFMALA